jgi:hypothetical protein
MESSLFDLDNSNPRLLYKVIPNKGHPSYHVRFHVLWDGKNITQERPALL